MLPRRFVYIVRYTLHVVRVVVVVVGVVGVSLGCRVVGAVDVAPGGLGALTHHTAVSEIDVFPTPAAL